ncbi:MAG: hypothetical protein CMF59_00660 [Leptospiraceae bacterium]|nr:hypothetical protein [Leptospiraceae bacterium]
MPESSEHEFELLKQEHVRLLRTINHDIKSPLHAIQSLTQMFAQNPDSFSESELETMAVEINRSVGGIGEILESMLAWMDYQRSRYSLAKQSESLQDEVELALAELKPRAETKGITLDAELDPVLIDCMETGLRRCMKILLSNAIKFSPDNSTVKVRSRTDSSGNVRLTVQDQGHGLSEKARNQLFTLEERIISEGTRGEKGAGLGLLMARDIMERSGGQVGFENVEQGACFYLELKMGEEK